MNALSLKFAALQDHVTSSSKKNRKYAVSGLYRFNTEDLPDVTPCHKGYKLLFRNGDKAYFHPAERNSFYRLGAHVLSELLQMGNTPDIMAIENPGELLYPGKAPKSEIGTICEWLNGDLAQRFLRGDKDWKSKVNKDSLIKLYLFFLISRDADFHGRNIIVVPDKNSLYSFHAIDLEKCASKIPKFLKKFDKFPVELRQMIEGEPIPDKILENFQKFIENYKNNKSRLLPFFNYNERKVEPFFRVTEKLLETGIVPRKEDIAQLYAFDQIV